MKEWHSAEIGGERQGTREEDRAATLGQMDCEDAAIEAGVSGSQPGDGQRSPKRVEETFLARQMEHWIASMERLQLSEYMRYVNDRKRMFWSNFLGGMARGVGTAVGFTILGAILVLILQNLAKRNLPLIGDALAQIVSIVQKRLQ